MKSLKFFTLVSLLMLPLFAQASDGVTHVVVLWTKPGTSVEALRQVVDKGVILNDVEGVSELHIGTAVASDRSIVDDSFQIGITMRFPSQEVMRAYLAHPDHVDYVRRYVTPIAAKIVVYDIQG
ncbi:MAG: Dabb family protein [Pseudomonadales bacterium]